MIRIILIDDHQLVRSGLKQILSEESCFEVIAEGQNDFDALKLAENLNADVMLLDINMPGKTGLDILPEIKKMKPTMSILMLSMNPEEQFTVRSINTPTIKARGVFVAKISTGLSFLKGNCLLILLYKFSGPVPIIIFLQLKITRFIKTPGFLAENIIYRA
jgi:CheY-like chemotaxis protein